MGVIGTGNRGVSLMNIALRLDASITALCDLNPAAAERSADIVLKQTGRKPALFSGDAQAYRRLLEREDLDAVVIATPEPLHARMSMHAMQAGKHVLSEVAAATTLDDGWALIEAVDKTGRTYMMAENCCYYRSNLAVLNMVRSGLFGELTYAECGYVHELRQMYFRPDGSLTWRGELGAMPWNWYPTHAIGPVAQWMGINHGDRFSELIAMAGSNAGIDAYTRRFPAGSAAHSTKFPGDSVVCLIQTEKGRLIELRLDLTSPRPHPSTTYFNLQGSRASYKDEEDERRIWIESRSKSYDWESFAPYLKEFDSDLWQQHEQEAKVTGHGGADYFTVRAFVQCVQSGSPSPINVQDAVSWSSIIPLSGNALRSKARAQQFPDFTSGKWKHPA